MSKHIVISDEARKKLEKIKLIRPQDTSIAQTVDHLIYIYEEQQFRQIKIPGSASPIIDAEKLQNAEVKKP